MGRFDVLDDFVLGHFPEVRVARMGDILPDVDIDIAVIRGPEFRLRGLVEIVAVSALHLVEGQVSFAGAFRTEYGVFVELEVADLHLVQ